VALYLAPSIREGPNAAVNQAIIWLPTGVAIAGLWLLGLRATWVVALCTLLGRLSIGYDARIILPAVLGSTAETVLGVLVLRRLDFRSSMTRVRDVGALGAAAAVAPVASIVLSWLGRSLFWKNLPFYSGWDGWWRMNALGVLTIVPVAVTWLGAPRKPLTLRVALGAALACVAIPAVLYAAMGVVPQGIIGVMLLTFVLAPALYAAVRFGVRAATLAGALSAIAVALATTTGVGPFLDVPFEQRHVAIQLFELVFVALPLVIAALVAERESAVERGDYSDQLRRSIQSALPDLIYRVNAEGICLDMIVPEGANSLLQPKDVVGRRVTDFIPANWHGELRGAMRQTLLDRKPATVEYELVIDGRTYSREARCVGYDENQILAIVRDITDRKWSEGTMAFEARVLNRVAAGDSPDAVFAEIVHGIEALTRDGLCVIMTLEGDRLHVAMAPSLPDAYNAAVEGIQIGPMVGSCGAAAFTGKTIVVPDIASDEKWAPYRDHALVHGLHACWSVPIRDSRGVVLGTFAIYHRDRREPDRAELALAERAGALAGIVLDRENRSEELRHSEDLLASLNRNVREGLFRATPDLRLVYANAALANLLGFLSSEDALGRSLIAAVDEADRREELGRLEYREGLWFHEEVRFRRRDGGAFWGLISITAVRDERGTVTSHDGAVTDITARKELEEQFRQAQKMEAVGKLAGGVAHDFNNLLTVILGYGSSIRSEAQENEGIRAQADQVVEAAQRASGLTRQLLAYSRQQVLSPQILELNKVVDEMGDMLHRLIGENIELVIRHEAGPRWVRVDRSQLEQVLLNLVVNARDAMPGDGMLRITTGATAAPRQSVAAAKSVASGPVVTLSVQDTGEGIPAELQSRVFDPFFTTKGPGKGTGLGLSTVYGIVRQSGGVIGLESAPGAGATFWIELPEVAPGPDAHLTAAPALSGAEGATILVVEDEAMVRDLVCRSLRLDGHTVLEAVDGANALDACRLHAGAIDLVVTDVVMPHMGGRELAERMLRKRPELRFLFVSGYPEDARDLGELVGPADAFLAKPFTPNQLCDRVRELLRSRAAAE
jgi:PAS domain S-box-containing protein